MKQVDLALKLDISKSYLSEIESNKKTVSMDLLQKYSVIFSIPASSLLLFSENIYSTKASEKVRLKCTNKILKIIEWMNYKETIND